MDLSIIIVNYNVKEFLHNLLNSIIPAVKSIAAEVIVVDNASEDGSVEMLKKDFPAVTLIESSQNLGFSRANNLALKMAKGRYLLLLNPDTIVSEDTFEIIIRFLDEHPEAGLAGCKILNPDGTLQLPCRRGFPTPWTSFCKVTGLSSLFPKSKLLARYNLTYLDEDQTYEVDAVSGSFMMIRKSVYDEIGGLDEQFFMYGEDLDWCYRVQKAGHKVLYVHSAKVIHYKGESTRRSNIDETKIFYGAMKLFVRKHFSTHYIVEALLTFAISIRHFLAFLGRWRLIFLSIVLDSFFFSLSLYAAENLYRMRVQWRGFPDSALEIVYTAPLLLYVLTAFALGAYNKDRISILRSVLTLLPVFLILSSLTYFFRDFAYSRAVLLMTFVGAGFTFLLWRTAAKVLFKTGNLYSAQLTRKIVVVGTSDTAVLIAKKLQSKHSHYYKIAGFIALDRKSIGDELEGFPVFGTLDMVEKVLREQNIHEVIFSTADIPYTAIMQVISSLKNRSIEFKIAGSNIDFLVGKKEVSLIDDISVVDFSYNIVLPGNRFIKRCFDIIAAIGIFIFYFPIALFIGRFRREPAIARFISCLPKVILGTMSLIGPAQQKENSVVLGKPGATGYWLTENEPERNFEKLDIFYAKNQNIWLDIEILSKTIMIIFLGKN